MERQTFYAGDNLSKFMRLNKPWLPLEDSQVEQIGAQLGVFELADDSGQGAVHRRC